MKKTALFVFTIVFAAAFGVASAGEVGNGITIFNGKSIDTLADLYPAETDAMIGSVEGSGAGGLRSADPGAEPFNGITDFTGKSYDTLADYGPAVPGEMSVESSHAGGPRSAEPISDLSNGITNFSGKSYDTLSDLDR